MPTGTPKECPVIGSMCDCDTRGYITLTTLLFTRVIDNDFSGGYVNVDRLNATGIGQVSKEILWRLFTVVILKYAYIVAL